MPKFTAPSRIFTFVTAFSRIFDWVTAFALIFPAVTAFCFSLPVPTFCDALFAAQTAPPPRARKSAKVAITFA